MDELEGWNEVVKDLETQKRPQKTRIIGKKETSP